MSTTRTASRSARRRTRGQSLVEFALVVPVIVVLAVAIGDFGRVFAAAVATESAAREAADYGGFLGSAAWPAAGAPWTNNDAEIRRRACTAMSQTPGFSDPDGSCSSNPTVAWQLLTWNRTTNVTAPADPASVDCSSRTAFQDPCVVHVTVSFTFRPVWPLPPVPDSIVVSRDSWFTLTDLTGS